MKSVIFLHGGNTSDKFENNQNFWRDLLGETNARHCDSKLINLLVIPFAGLDELRFHGGDYESLGRSELTTISNRLNSKHENVIIGRYASLDAEEFKQQIKGADLIFVSGGNGNLLQETIENMIPIDEFRELVSNDKVIAGVSAGGNLFSRFHWSRMNNAVTEGFNILPVRNFPHYDYNRDFEVKQLENHRSNIELELIKLMDWEYVKREVK